MGRGERQGTKGKEQKSNGSFTQLHKENESQKTTAKPCSMYSSTGHLLANCPQFQDKSLAECKEFIQANRICFGCLKKGHYSQDCKRRCKCDKCGKHHPTIPHEEHLESGNEGSKPSEREGSDKASATSCKVHLGNNGSTSMIVPVWVSSEQAPSIEVLTYALLDTLSDSSFVLDDVAKSLGVEHQPVQLKLSTMSSSSTISCSAGSGLLVRGMALPIQLRLEKCYTHHIILGDRQHIPTKATAEQ